MQANNNMANVAKTQGPAKDKRELSDADRKLLSRAYYRMYRASLLKNLLAGMTFGAASYNARQFVRSKIASMDKDNPVTKYLTRLHDNHSKRVAKRVMTSKYRNTHATATPATAQKLNDRIPNWIKSAVNTFNNMAKKYQQKEKEAVKAQSPQKPSPLFTAVPQLQKATQQQKPGNLAPKMPQTKPQEQPANIIKFIFLRNGRGSQKAA